MATEIVLSAGQVAVVDDADVDFITQWKWSASKCHGTGPTKKYVAIRSVRLPGGKRKTYFMHRVLLGLDHGDETQADHINHDTLDNRRSNLRPLTPTANKRWQPSRGGTSQYVGVSWSKARKKWCAQIQVAGRMFNLGQYPTEMEAAIARDSYVLANRTGHGLNILKAA